MADPVTPEEQLHLWLKGASVCPNTQSACCPDFSCCQPQLLASLEERQAFVDGTDETRHHLLGGFLGVAMAAAIPDKKVHVAGTVPDHHDA